MIALCAALGNSVFRDRRWSQADTIREESASANGDRWFLKDAPLPGHKRVLQWWQRRFVVAEGAGLHIGDVALRTVGYLWKMEREDDKKDNLMWSGRKVLEIGCGCGYISVALSRWGASVVASDIHMEALTLTQANVKLNASRDSLVQLCRFDCVEQDSCTQLCEKFGPFDVIISVDSVLNSPTLGGKWQHSEEVQVVAISPSKMLDATRELSSRNSEIILVVVDRAGEVKSTAQALLERRRWLELAARPCTLELNSKGGTTAVVFRIRWRRELGVGGQVATELWPFLKST